MEKNNYIRKCEDCKEYCDGFCDLKGYLVEPDDLACVKFSSAYMGDDKDGGKFSSAYMEDDKEGGKVPL